MKESKGYLFLVILLAAILTSCSGEKVDKNPNYAVDAGKVEHFDLGDLILKSDLPDSVIAFLPMGDAPNFNYGLRVAKNNLPNTVHEGSDLLLYIFRGSARFQIGSNSWTASMGDVIYIPRGTIYNATRKGSQDLQYLAVYSPPLDFTQKQ